MTKPYLWVLSVEGLIACISMFTAFWLAVVKSNSLFVAIGLFSLLVMVYCNSNIFYGIIEKGDKKDAK